MPPSVCSIENRHGSRLVALQPKGHRSETQFRYLKAGSSKSCVVHVQKGSVPTGYVRRSVFPSDSSPEPPRRPALGQAIALDPGVPGRPTGCSPGGTSNSLLQELEEPPRSNYAGSQGLSPPPQLAIRGDEGDHLIRDVGDDINEGVVTAAGSVEDRDAIGDAVRDALASPAFQDHDHRLRDPSRVNGGSYLVHEGSGCSCSVPPPAGRARPDHICCIDEKHGSSLIAGRMAARLFSRDHPARPTRLHSSFLKPVPRAGVRRNEPIPARSGPASLDEGRDAALVRPGVLRLGCRLATGPSTKERAVAETDAAGIMVGREAGGSSADGVETRNAIDPRGRARRHPRR